MKSSEYYSTTCEIQFIEGLGTFSSIKTQRFELLKKYLIACVNRVRWDGLKRSEIIEKVYSEIDKEMGNIK